MTQTEKVKEALTGEQMTIKEVAQNLGIKEPNIRRILGQGVKKGLFKRIAKGVYTIETKNGVTAYVKVCDALEEIKTVTQKFDMVFLDIPYRTKAVIGGSRGVKYDLISPSQFSDFLGNLKNCIEKDTPVYYMYSNAPSGKKEMEQYTQAFDTLGFKLIASGYWKKTYGNRQRLFGRGSECVNVRGEKALPEGIKLFSLSGNCRQYENIILEFEMQKTKVASQKPLLLVKQLIHQVTKERDTILDPFAGSGIVGKASIELLRNIVLWEKSGKRVHREILPLLS